MADGNAGVVRRFGVGLVGCGLVLGLVACGSDPEARVRADVDAITEAANGGNAADVRARVADLQLTLDDQVARGELDSSRADQIRSFALQVSESADVLEAPTAPPAVEEVPEPAAPAPAAPEPDQDDDGDDDEDDGDDDKGKGGGNGKSKGNEKD